MARRTSKYGGLNVSVSLSRWDGKDKTILETREKDNYDVKFRQSMVQKHMQSNKPKSLDEWSDEESDYKWQTGPIMPVPKHDNSTIDQIGESVNGKLPHRHVRPHMISGHAKIDDFRGFYPAEIEKKKKEEEELFPDLTLPLPRVPPHVFKALGERALKLIWQEFLYHDADESEMIILEHMPDVANNVLNILNYMIPFEEIDYKDLEVDDYVDFQFVTGELAKHLGIRGTENPINEKWERPHALPPCCAFQACAYHTWQNQHNPSETFALNLVFNRMKLDRQGNVRQKHVFQMMDDVNIPYDMEEIPPEFMHLEGDKLIENIKQLEDLIDRLRIAEEEKEDDLYEVPKWLKTEFTDNEIMMFKHHFQVIDVDGGGDIDAEELMKLCESLGSRITLEKANKLIDDYDLDQSGTIDFGEFLALMFKIQSGTVDMADDMFATALMESKAQIKIYDEIEEVSNNPPNEYVTVSHYGKNPVEAVFKIKGPPDSIYAGAEFELEVIFQPGYPYRQPSIRFLSRIIHINFIMQVDGTGHMKHLDLLWDSRWNMHMLLDHVIKLLVHAKMSYVPIHLRETLFMFMAETGQSYESLDFFDEEDSILIQNEFHTAQETHAYLQAQAEEQEKIEAAVEEVALTEATGVNEEAGEAKAETKEGESKVNTTSSTKADSKISQELKEEVTVNMQASEKEGKLDDRGDKEGGTEETAEGKEGEDNDDELKEEGTAAKKEIFGYTDHIQAMSRMHQMHMNVLSLYLIDYNKFYEIVRHNIDRYLVAEPEDSEVVVGDPGSLEVDAGDSYLVKSLVIPEAGKKQLDRDQFAMEGMTNLVHGRRR